MLGILERIFPSEHVFTEQLFVIYELQIKCDAHSQNPQSLFWDISAVSVYNFTQINVENFQK